MISIDDQVKSIVAIQLNKLDYKDEISDRVIAKLQELDIIKPVFDNKGNMWGEFEEEKLRSRFSDFLDMAAKAHGRTSAAIRARIKLILN